MIARFLFLAAIALLSGAPALAATSILGSWLTDDHKAIVRIAQCGPHLCGRIANILDKAPNVPAVDVNNPDPGLKSRKLVGLPILIGFRDGGEAWTGGRAYDPKSGKSYRSILKRNPDGSLKVSGCVLFICQSRRWTPAR